MMRWVVAAVGVAACCWIPSVAVVWAEPRADAKKRAEELFVEATKLAGEKRWEEAIEKFRESDRVLPYASNDCNIATVYSLMGRPAQAQLYLGRCVERHGGVIPSAERGQVDATRREVDAMLTDGDFARVEIEADPAVSQVRVSSFAPEDVFTAGRTIWLPLGSHELVVSSPGYVAIARRITIADKATRREVFRLGAEMGQAPVLLERRVPVAEPAARRGPLPHVLVGAGAAAAAVGVLFTVLAFDARDDAAAAARGEDRAGYDDAVDRMKRYNVGFGAAYAVGAVSLGVGVYLFLRPRASGPAEGLSVGAAPSAVTVGWQTAW
jgi:hypothetical protein